MTDTILKTAAGEFFALIDQIRKTHPGIEVTIRCQHGGWVQGSVIGLPQVTDENGYRSGNVGTRDTRDLDALFVDLLNFTSRHMDRSKEGPK